MGAKIVRRVLEEHVKVRRVPPTCRPPLSGLHLKLTVCGLFFVAAVDMSSVTKVNLSSYPRPSDTIPLAPLTPRPLPRLIAPVLPAHLPTPPTSRVAHPAIADQYVLSTHIIPAALPRLAADVPIPSPPAFSPDKQKWNAAVDAKRDEILDLKVKHWNGELGGGGTTQFWQCLDRYVRKDAALRADGSGLTLLFTHANGFPKEVR